MAGASESAAVKKKKTGKILQTFLKTVNEQSVAASQIQLKLPCKEKHYTNKVSQGGLILWAEDCAEMKNS